MADSPTRLTLPGVPCMVCLVIPQISSHPAHPTHSCPRVQWVGSSAGREGSKQETGSVEHHSRATRNGARAKNSSRALCRAGQPLLGREGAGTALSQGPHSHHCSRGSCQAATEQDLPSWKRSPGGALSWEN